MNQLINKVQALSLSPSSIAQAVVAAFKRMTGKLPMAELAYLLVDEEAKLGGQLFGSTNPQHPRQFVRVDARRWLWREPTPTGYDEVMYEVTDQAVYKTHRGQTMEVSGQELRNLHLAVTAYSGKVNRLYATL